VEGCSVREVPREFGPWIFLVPPILVKIIIFVLSKDQTFRIRCTLMDLAQFLILATQLYIYIFFENTIKDLLYNYVYHGGFLS
jgi:hypothetical protein